MKLLTPENITDQQLVVFHNYGKVRKAVRNFTISAKPDTFDFLFGEKEGERLWKHFVTDCSKRWSKLETYLTNDQRNILMLNIVYNNSLTFNI